ncbi:hypothetical protein K458DRAFT_429597 [Lentithecium fluviatile CBS 122367]|uniref:Uncharacterized protein n=1 Tax=Lentithecium fluviatile CBS 122367 TaxID=1168545 RepID=A0A6G1J884_9PLEO|nr:hypothetical protein K458DRAFT_429597 [Lentithecium fluviatile CBS 122367]
MDIAQLLALGLQEAFSIFQPLQLVEAEHVVNARHLIEGLALPWPDTEDSGESASTSRAGSPTPGEYDKIPDTQSRQKIQTKMMTRKTMKTTRNTAKTTTIATKAP